MAAVYPLERSRPSSPGQALGENGPKPRSGWWWVLWAWEQSLGSPTQKAVLLALAKHADADGVCWPSIARIRTLTDLKSDRAVQNSLRALEDRGLVMTDERRGTSSLYRLTPARNAPPHEMHPAGDAPDPRTNCTPPPQEMHGPPAGDAPKLPRTPNEETRGPCAADAAHTFDFDGFMRRFLEAYPRHGNLEATEAELRQAIEDGADAEHILAGARAYAAEQKGNARQYIAFSENWLAKKRWEQFARPGNTSATDPAQAAKVEEGYLHAIRTGNEAVGKYTPLPLARKFIAEGRATQAECRVVGLDP